MTKKLTFTKIKQKFFSLPQKEQEKFLKDLYNFIPDIKVIFLNKFNKNPLNNGQTFIEQMKKETYEKIKHMKNIKLNNLNKIISKAKKSYVVGFTLIELEKIAYRGLVEFADEYGYFGEVEENAASRHLENFIKYVIEFISEKSEHEDIFQNEKIYL